MNQRTVAIVIVGAVALLVGAVVAGLVIGGVIGAVADKEDGLQVRTEQPASMDELRDSYKLETGTLEINLEDVDLPEGATELRAKVDTGALTVVVPKGVAVKAEAEVGTGSMSILDTTAVGENLKKDYESEDYDQADRRLALDLTVGTGVISVERES